MVFCWFNFTNLLKNTLREEENHFLEGKNEFLEKIRNCVSSMSTRFSQLFSFVGCRGQLVLKEVEELKNLSIEINVSFRDDQPLLPLSGSRNSGGEKMVSVMLYIFSMQHLTKAPFRLVDEMNQVIFVLEHSTMLIDVRVWILGLRERLFR